MELLRDRCVSNGMNELRLRIVRMVRNRVRILCSLAIGSAVFFAARVVLARSATFDQSSEAFLTAYRVLQHPRCLNCHPSGDTPLQGDDSHPHAFRVKRGADGTGVSAMKCANCHQVENRPEGNAPPGAAGWQLPPTSMRMSFQGKSATELCRQLKDPKLNGGRTIDRVVNHLDTTLVRWAWQPGSDRTTPPLSYDEFVGAMKKWAANGASCP